MPASRPSRHGPLARGARAGGSLALLLAVVSAGAGGYTVRAGDTLSGIAARHGASEAQIAALNAIADPDRIYAGQTLQLPGAASAPPGEPAVGSHAVQPGETLSEIAARHGVTTRALAERNGLSDPDRIVAGQRLEIPAGAAGAAGVQATGPAVAATAGQAESLLSSAAQRYGWSSAFVKAVAWQESGWSNTVVSSQGAIGIMQVLPETGEFVSRHIVGRPLDLHDPADNVEAGVAFLDYLHGLTGGDAHRILAGYYQGLGSVERNGVYPSTERYIDNVLALRERFR